MLQGTFQQISVAQKRQPGGSAASPGPRGVENTVQEETQTWSMRQKERR